MQEVHSGHKLAETSKLTVKILNVLYVGGAYGLIAMTLVQAMILVSWIRH
ncbi:MAG: hypothetical protein HQL94_11370 [Magnetococcales bacterium]|nr:hypothetical protein [Magnetococcales bacterium]MBF0438394.1 hypothetical protein [Magnetococcales bacterium]